MAERKGARAPQPGSETSRAHVFCVSKDDAYRAAALVAVRRVGAAAAPEPRAPGSARAAFGRRASLARAPTCRRARRARERRCPLAAYLALLEDPQTALATKAVTAGVIIGAGDAAAQLVEGSQRQGDGESDDGEGGFDPGALRALGLLGLVLQAPWNHFYYMALDGAIPPTPEPFTTTTAVKVAIDQFVQAPIFTAIIFVFFAVIEGRGLDAARRQISDELGQVLVKNWAVFLPATFINLAFLPNELRVLFLNAVFFFWVIYLSLTREREAGEPSWRSGVRSRVCLRGLESYHRFRRRRGRFVVQEADADGSLAV